MTQLPSAPLEAPVADRDRMVIYLAILMALFLAALDQTIVATALPRMVEDLQGIVVLCSGIDSLVLLDVMLNMSLAAVGDDMLPNAVFLGQLLDNFCDGRPDGVVFFRVHVSRGNAGIENAFNLSAILMLDFHKDF